MAKSKVKIKWNNQGFKEILQSEELEEVCVDAAEKIARNAEAMAGAYQKKGKDAPEFVALKWHSNMKGGRVAAVAATRHDEAREIQAEHHILEKATYTTKA